MKSKKYNKFRKNRKKTQKKVYKKTEKKVNIRKHNTKKTYRKKGGAKELCLKQSQEEPSENDPEVAINKKCNEYFFEYYDSKNNKYDYYAWRNPDNTFRKNYDKIRKCRLVDNYKKYKKCPKHVGDLKKEERIQIKQKINEQRRQREKRLQEEEEKAEEKEMQRNKLNTQRNKLNTQRKKSAESRSKKKSVESRSEKPVDDIDDEPRLYPEDPYNSYQSHQSY